MNFLSRSMTKRGIFLPLNFIATTLSRSIKRSLSVIKGVSVQRKYNKKSENPLRFQVIFFGSGDLDGDEFTHRHGSAPHKDLPVDIRAFVLAAAHESAVRHHLVHEYTLHRAYPRLVVAVRNVALEGHEPVETALLLLLRHVILEMGGIVGALLLGVQQDFVSQWHYHL